MRCPEHTGCKSAASGFSRPRNLVTCGCSKPEKGRHVLHRFPQPSLALAGASGRGEEGRASAFDRHGAASFRRHRHVPAADLRSARRPVSVHLYRRWPGESLGRRAPWRHLHRASGDGFRSRPRKLVGWEGGAVHFNTFAIHGRGLSRYNLNNILTASDIEALSTYRLSELWYEHRFFDKIYIRAGQLAADQEFLTSKLAGLFINGTFGWPGITGVDLPSGGPAFPSRRPARGSNLRRRRTSRCLRPSSTATPPDPDPTTRSGATGS